MEWKLYLVKGIELIFLGIGTFFDIKSQRLPVNFLCLFTGISVLENIILQYQEGKEMVFGITMGIFFLMLGWITKETIGYGDGWSLLILGIMEGGNKLAKIVILAFGLSAFWGIWKLIVLREGRDSTLPFLPCLFVSVLGMSIL